MVQKGKAQGKGWQMKGHGKGKCDHCGKTGHTSSNCWVLHPEQLPWTGANAVDEHDQQWSNIEIGHVCAQHALLPVLPPGLAPNRFEALQEKESEKDVEIGVMSYELSLSSVDKEKSASVNQVTTKYSGRYVSAGKGKITVDSGAGESVMPKDLLLGEELVEGQQKENGVNYIAASGNRKDNYGEKKIRFRKGG